MRSQRAFGEALRRHRERSGVTVESIARQTKISASMLAALERGDCSRWPTGIYSRSYVRDYAQAVGLDPDDLAAQFSACFADTAFPGRAPELARKTPPEPSSTQPLRLTLDAQPASRRRTAGRRSALFALDLLLILVIASALRMTVVPDFWMALAGVAIACHALGRAGGGSGAADLFTRAFRSTPDAAPAETPRESAVAETPRESAVAEPA